MSQPPVHVEGLNHFYGSGAVRRQVLYDFELRIDPGEIVILTGPSGSGKTTALTLIGALRSAQDGSLRVLGHELNGASRADLTKVRREIGFIFQYHNLLEALTAGQNIALSPSLYGVVGRKETQERVLQMLDAVGLPDKIDSRPGELSGGQKQRVAIARALVGEPRMILADEPTASLDKQSGRDVVAMMQRLAKEQEVAVVLVTHDNRILDVADRIVHLEDGRLRSFTEAVSNNTEQMMGLLTESQKKGDLAAEIGEMEAGEFVEALGRATREAEEFVRVTRSSSRAAFESMLDQALQAFTHKIVDVMDAEQGSLFLLDARRGELWSKVTTDEEPIEIRMPRDAGIAGAVLTSGVAEAIPDAYGDPRFNRAVDDESGFRTRSILAVPLRRSSGEVFGVAELLNKRDAEAFPNADLARFQELTSSMSVLLDSWNQLHVGQADPTDETPP